MGQQKKKRKLPPGCTTCAWTGRVQSISIQKDGMTGLDVEIYAQAYCTCPRGIARQQIARARAEATAPR